jgi:hypothetical protein
MDTAAPSDGRYTAEQYFGLVEQGVSGILDRESP